MGVWQWFKEEGWKIILVLVVIVPIGIFNVIIEDREEQREKSQEAYIENCEWVEEDEYERQKACDDYRDRIVEKYGAANLLEAIVAHEGGEYYDGLSWARNEALGFLSDVDTADPLREEYEQLFLKYAAAEQEAAAKRKQARADRELHRIYRERAQEKKLTN